MSVDLCSLRYRERAVDEAMDVGRTALQRIYDVARTMFEYSRENKGKRMPAHEMFDHYSKLELATGTEPFSQSALMRGSLLMW